MMTDFYYIWNSNERTATNAALDHLDPLLILICCIANVNACKSLSLLSLRSPPPTESCPTFYCYLIAVMMIYWTIKATDYFYCWPRYFLEFFEYFVYCFLLNDQLIARSVLKWNYTLHSDYWRQAADCHRFASELNFYLFHLNLRLMKYDNDDDAAAAAGVDFDGGYDADNFYR
jgi:hypothetical protein